MITPYAMTVISALAYHRSNTMVSILPVNPECLKEQLHAATYDGFIDAINIGFLQNEATINIVADFIEQLSNTNIPVVVDPCIISRSGENLLNDASIAALKRRLYVHTTILTPNIKEAEVLGVMRITNIDDMRFAADMMRTLGVINVVLKGGRITDDKELYFVATPNEERIYQRPTVKTKHTIGAGNVLSSAMAVNLAKRMDIFSAVESALDFMHQAILRSDGFGYEEGPVNHAFHIQDQPKSFHPEDIKIYKI